MEDVSQGSTDTTSAPAPATAAPQATQAEQERTFRQSEVNDIVKRAKHGAVEDFRRLQTEQPEYAAKKFADQPTQTSDDNIRKLAAQEAQRLRDEWVSEAKSKSEADYAKKTVDTFWNKVQPGKEKYADFDEVTGGIEYARFPNVVQLLAEYVDNADDVLYDLGKNRIKMANLESLSYMSPKDAIVEAQRLSKSLKDNAAAGKVRQPNEPLSKILPSNTGTDNGVMSVKDYRAKYIV